VVIHPLDVSPDIVKARFAVETVAKALEIECDCSFLSIWVVKIDEGQRKSFMELVRSAVP